MSDGELSWLLLEVEGDAVYLVNPSIQDEPGGKAKAKDFVVTLIAGRYGIPKREVRRIWGYQRDPNRLLMGGQEYTLVLADI